uniref:Uncharacterized protein n=1 Tax=Anguilla anguilla TaxID=7936 RepID=A0A0E9TFJ4_ANGAN
MLRTPYGKKIRFADIEYVPEKIVLYDYMCSGFLRLNVSTGFANFLINET